MDLLWLSNQSSSDTNWSNYEIMLERPNFEAIPDRFHIYIILLYSFTAISAFCGNGISLVIFFNQRNKIISKYLINLACSDLLMALFSIPFTYTMFMFGRWYFTPELCPIVLGTQLCSLLVSVYTLLAIGIDRLIAIKKPLHLRTTSNQSTNLTIFFIWLFAIAFGCLAFKFTKISEIQLRNETILICHEDFSEHQIKYASIIIFVISFLLPVSLIGYIYITMACSIIKSSNSIVCKNKNMLGRRFQRRRIIRMMIVVVIAFICCWTPLQVFNLLSVFSTSVREFSTEFELNLYVFANFTFHWIAMAHSFINPIIYSFMSSNFKKELNKQLSGSLRRFRSSIKSGRSLSKTDELEFS